MKKAAVVLIFIIFVSCRDSINVIGKPQLGTLVNLTIIGDPESAPDAAQAVFSEIERVENLMSPARTGSDVFRLNGAAPGVPVAVNRETYDLLKKSAAVSAETDGCFDITFAGIAHLWDYKSRRFMPPDRAAVAGLLPLVDYKKIVFDPEKRSVAFGRQGMKIGLGAIAKGYAVHRGIEVLKGRGVRSAIVEAGGDLQVMGTKFGKQWTTGLRHPRKNSILLVIELDDGDSVATSGDYERFAVRNNRRYHHIIDPRTGYPAETFSSVSVLSKHAVLSDAYATAIFVMGLDGAREFLKRHAEIGVILADREVNLYISRKLKERITFLDRVRVEWL